MSALNFKCRCGASFGEDGIAFRIHLKGCRQMTTETVAQREARLEREADAYGATIDPRPSGNIQYLKRRREERDLDRRLAAKRPTKKEG